jgi:AraC family transcriptional regulator, transcriptional activator of pobA
MQRQEINTCELNQTYGFNWAINDFAVTDEKYPIKAHDFSVRIDGYILGICLKGKLEVELDANLYKGRKNSMLVAKPLQLFRWGNLSDDCRVRFIIFSKRFLIANNIHQHIIENFPFSRPNALPVIEIDDNEAIEIVRQFEVIWERFTKIKHPYRKEVVSGLLVVLLHDFAAIYQKHFGLLQPKSTRGEELTRQFMELVQKHFRKEHSVEYYARELHISSKYLTAAIKEGTGRTASAFIIEALAIEAQALLQQETVSVKEVANQLKFANQSTFGKFFKRAVGLSPLEYKKSPMKG